MRPRSGRSVPAMAFTIVLLPAPERPKSDTIGASEAKAASTGNEPRRRRMSTSIIAGGGPLAAHQPLGKRERSQRERHGQGRKAQRLRVLARRLREGVDRE